MVCSGRYAEPNLPLNSFPGIENFKGRYLHSWEYRDQKEFEGKNVLVIGAGNTGGDIASEVCRTAAKIFHSWTPVILNDELPSCILSGAIVVKPNVKEFTETSVIFEDGTMENHIDVIIFTTGYSASFPFLEEPIHNICKSSTSLYKYIFPPHLEKPTLAIIGFIAVNGSILPVTELQARWVTRVFNGKKSKLETKVL
ncbi:hypothetical protein JD844_017223 [Phrynosoma platyrhinos]|uniref:Flavin-containing monooxygenase n=1 Tax=Phrynosoma platyrhinos TaxID=52577 RepID=A0ABQ7SLI1_PHRPL|nr:hypothetical protein JD844_017223 [Phrynosoma platyrhinos]